jgi:hypothetical protein
MVSYQGRKYHIGSFTHKHNASSTFTRERITESLLTLSHASMYIPTCRESASSICILHRDDPQTDPLDRHRTYFGSTLPLPKRTPSPQQWQATKDASSAAAVRSKTMVRTELWSGSHAVRSTVQVSARTGPRYGSWFWASPNGSETTAKRTARIVIENPLYAFLLLSSHI